MWNASFDYVRLTSPAKGVDDEAPILYQLAQRGILAAQDASGVKLEPWAWQGYRGKSGPHIQVGSRSDGHILQASGYAADAVRELGLPFQNVPRADVAVTIWFGQDNASAIQHMAKLSRGFSTGKGGRGWRTTYIDGGEHGDTTYIGARSSDTYVRIYDKWRETGKGEEYKYAIRYECEYKGDAAKEVWTGEARISPGRAYLAGVVRATLRSRGVDLPDIGACDLAQAPAARTVATNTERRLAWLRNQVAPSIDKLLTDGVSRDTILASLGMSDREPRRIDTKLRS